MKTGTVFIAWLVVVFLLGGCSIRRDITRNPGDMTDFVPGQVYELKQSTWVWKGRLMTLREKEPLDSEGIVPAGTRLAISKIEFNKSFETGPYTKVYSEILTGNFRGQTIDVSVISNSTQSGYTKRDPEMLVPVED